MKRTGYRLPLSFILISTVLLLASCEEQDRIGDAFIGGEIINPKTSNVFIFRDGEAIDTLLLDDSDKFGLKLNDISTGMYSFMHGNEYQLAVIEPGDSVYLRVNTVDFDQSLVYMGIGAKKNNFLVQLFLEMEQESKSMFDTSKIDPAAFVKYIDSLETEKKQRLNNFIKQNKQSEVFSNLVNAGIKYNYGAMHEAYPFRHFTTLNKQALDQLPPNYFDFREGLDYNDSSLAHFHHYYNFLFPHFNTLALQKLVEKQPDLPVNQQTRDFYLTKLGLMDSQISHPVIKNNILKYTTKSLLSNTVDSEQQEDILQFFYNHSKSDEDKAYMANWYASISKIKSGQRFPEIEIVDPKGNTLNIHELFDKATVCTFWSTESKSHFENSHERLNYLRRTFDNINFISINTDYQKEDEWRSFLRAPNVVSGTEFRFRDPEAAKKMLALYNVNKVMLIDKNGNVTQPNANLFSRKFNLNLNKLQ